MSDALKKFISSHRDAFDTELPGEELWKKIERGIATKQAAPILSIRAFRRSLLAAVALVTAVSVVLFHRSPDDGMTGSNTGRDAAMASPEAKPKTDQAVAPMDSLYTQEMYYFSQIIHTKFLEVSKIRAAHPELYARFSSDLEKLDSTYQQLKQKLPGQVNQEMLLKAMLNNLTLQVNLINRQLDIIQQLKTESHENVTKRI
jgi:hypothetical protein